MRTTVNLNLSLPIPMVGALRLETIERSKITGIEIRVLDLIIECVYEKFPDIKRECQKALLEKQKALGSWQKKISGVEEEEFDTNPHKLPMR